MFTALPPVQQFTGPTFSNPSAWVPAHPSPLSPRRTPPSPTTTTSSLFTTPKMSANTPQSIFTFSPTTPDQHNINNSLTSPTPPGKNSSTPLSSRSRTSQTFAQRYSSRISNPLNQASSRSASSSRHTTSPSSSFASSSTSPSARTARRNAFLNRIRQDRENGRFETRGEQLMFMEDAAEQRKWGESMRREAEKIAIRLEDEEDEADMYALDEYLAQEHMLEMELLQQIDGGGGAQVHFSGSGQHGMQNDAGSFSDEEYDGIFMDLVDRSSAGQQDVDMSSG